MQDALLSTDCRIKHWDFCFNWLWIYKVMQENGLFARSTVCHTWKSGKFPVCLPRRCQLIAVFKKKKKKKASKSAVLPAASAKHCKSAKRPSRPHIRIPATSGLTRSPCMQTIWPTWIGDCAPWYRRRPSVWVSASLSRRRLELRAWPPGDRLEAFARRCPSLPFPAAAAWCHAVGINRQQRS